MLKNIDLDVHLDPGDHTARQGYLLYELSRVQRMAHEEGLGVLIIVEGWNYAGKPQLVKFLTERMDPRAFKVCTWLPPGSVHRGQPLARRYMEKMPRRGELVFFIRSWYSEELERRADARRSRRLRWKDIRALEGSLAQDGILVVKLWLHLGRNELVRRHHREPHDIQWSPVVGKRQSERYGRYCKIASKMLTATNCEGSPWLVLPATCNRYLQFSGAEALITAISSHLEGQRPAPEIAPAPIPLPARLEALDLRVDVNKERYLAELESLQARLAQAQHQAVQDGRSVVMVFEGWDASGKGGAIRRMRETLNPCFYEVHSIGPPEGDDKRHHYLWRFWRRLPPRSHWGIFDRSWYGRVLVERIESFATTAEWQRAYEEICVFEEQLLRAGTTVLKFWLHISDEEQLRRFEDRQAKDHKRYKITDEDWRNRDKREAYTLSAEEMFARTDRPGAPWILLAAESKRNARLAVMRHVLAAIETPP